MDTTSLSPASAPPTGSTGKPVLYIILAGLFCMVIGALILYVSHGNRSASTLVPLSGVLISAGPFTDSTLYAPDASNTLRQVEVVVEGRTHKVLDERSLPNGSVLYLLIDSPAKFVSNLYLRKPDGAIEKLTDTDTTKVNLQVRNEGTEAFYQEKFITAVQQLTLEQDWNVQRYSLATRKTELQGTAARAYVTASGLVLNAQRGGLSLVKAAGTSTELLKPDSATAFALNAKGTILAARNARTMHIDLYSVAANGLLSYQRSTKGVPDADIMGFIGDELVYAELQPSGQGDHTMQDVILRTEQGTPTALHLLSTLSLQRLYEK